MTRRAFPASTATTGDGEAEGAFGVEAGSAGPSGVRDDEPYELLEHIDGHQGVWYATHGQVADHFLKQAS
jgi:hypothetical protein